MTDLAQITLNFFDFIADVEAPPEFPEIYIPPPAPILFGMYTRKHTIWLSVGGFDFGYLYEYTMSSVGPVRTTPLAGATEEEAFCFHILEYVYFIARPSRLIGNNAVLHEE